MSTEELQAELNEACKIIDDLMAEQYARGQPSDATTHELPQANRSNSDSGADGQHV